MRYSTVTLGMAVFICGARGSAAATTGLDSTFGSGGIVLIGPSPTKRTIMRRVSALLIQGDGKILIGGYVWDAQNGAELPAVGRLNEDASWDPTFADDGVFTLPFGAAAAPHGGRIDKLAVFSNGSLLASGSQHDWTKFQYSSCTALLKITTDGVLDTGFAPDKSGAYCFDFAPPPDNFSVHYHWDDIKIDSDDSFLMTTPTTNIDYVAAAIARFDASGALVDVYGSNGIAMASQSVAAASQIELLSNHSAVVVGVAGTMNSQGLGASRLDENGDLDLSYGTNGASAIDVQTGASVGIPYAAADTTMRLLISNYSYMSDIGYSPYRIARLTSTGAVDTTFNGNGQQAGGPGVAVLTLSSNPDNDEILGAQPLDDGHILVVGQNAKVVEGDGTFNLSLLRLNDNASWDTSFGDAAHVGWSSLSVGGNTDSDTRPESLALDPRSGRLVIGIGTNDANANACIGLVRMVPDRLLDSNFEPAPPMPTCPQ